jgi:uncharacterized membrane protein YfcA
MAMDAFVFVVATSGLFSAGVIKGATGLGYATAALPFLVHVLGLQPAMSLVLIPAMATNVMLAVTGGHLKDTLRNFWPLYLAMLPGIVIGLWLLLSIEQRSAVAGLGFVMISYAFFALCRPDIRIPVGWQGHLKVPTGLLNGILTGLTGSQVMPLLPYMLGLNLVPARMVQAVNAAVLFASSALLLGLTMNGILTTELFILSIAAIVPALVGTFVGTRLRNRLPAHQFRQIVLLVIALMGFVMVVGG